MSARPAGGWGQKYQTRTRIFLKVRSTYCEYFKKMTYIHKKKNIYSDLCSEAHKCNFPHYKSVCWDSAVTQLVEALRYKPEGRGFDSR